MIALLLLGCGSEQSDGEPFDPALCANEGPARWTWTTPEADAADQCDETAPPRGGNWLGCVGTADTDRADRAELCSVAETLGARCAKILATDEEECPDFEAFLSKAGWMVGEPRGEPSDRNSRYHAYHCLDGAARAHDVYTWHVDGEVSDEYTFILVWSNEWNVMFDAESGRLEAIQVHAGGNASVEYCCGPAGVPTFALTWGPYVDGLTCTREGTWEWTPADFE